MSEIRNRKAFFHYEILDRMVAGIVLFGSEVKSIRAGRGSFAGAYVTIRNGEAWLKGFTIPHWEYSQKIIDPVRDRKLLLKTKEIIRVEKKLEEQGLTIVPLRLFFIRGYAKVEIALARGKRNYDKRETIKARDIDRQLAQRIKKNR